MVMAGSRTVGGAHTVGAGLAVDALVAVGYVEEEVLVAVLLIQVIHGGRGGWDHVVDEEEQCILWPQVNTLSDQEVELSDCQVRRHQVLFLIQIADSGLWCFLDDHLDERGNRSD